MPAKVTLNVTRGKLVGKSWIFDERSTCVLGRAEDCQPQIPSDDDHKTISRHHCLLDVNPPDVRIRDFGSMNGTFVNGAKIGQRPKGQSAEEGKRLQLPEYDLKDGDEITLGNTIFRVSVFVPAVCADCSCEIPEEQKASAQRSSGVFQCDTCRKKAEAARRVEPPRPRGKVCAQCGRDASAEIGDNRHGDYVCASCKADPRQVVDRLLGLARAGDREVLAVEGYEIQRELGRGGMGAVYLARHAKSGRTVALKVMLPKVAANETARAKFLREAECTRVLKHRNLVECYDVGCSHGTFFFTLEFCDGGSVDRLVQQRGGKLPVAEAGPILLDMLAGLEQAHNVEFTVPGTDGSPTPVRGLLHRDLKPHNVFLSGSGTSRVAKIGDFGLAKSFDQAGLSDMTRTGAAAGTPHFMPRQQVVNFKYARPEVDVWAAAASLYFLLTGKVPRDFVPGRDPWQTVLQTEPVPIRSRDSSIPERLAKVLDEALRDKPAIPFKTAGDFRKALEGVL